MEIAFFLIPNMGGIGTIELAIKNTENLNGEIWECGVFEGETSLRIKEILDRRNSNKPLRLFDSFEGMPYSGFHDVHEIGSMIADVNIVRKKFTKPDGSMVSDVYIEKGVMPASLEKFGDTKIAIAWIDVDNYESVKKCLEFIYPRVPDGGWIILDDYYCSNCPGAKLATDEFLKGKQEHLIFDDDHQNPQAYFVKGWLKQAEKEFLLTL